MIHPTTRVATWPADADQIGARHARGLVLLFDDGSRRARALCLGPGEGWLVLDSAGEPHGPYTAQAARVALGELLGDRS